MYRKDFIDSEIQKLAQVLAKIIGLKNEGNVDDASILATHSLNEDFGIDREILEKQSVEEFKDLLKVKNYPADKLNLLGALMFESVHPFLETEETMQVLHKTALVLNTLETEYHQQSFENLHRREMIDKFLSNLQYE